MASTKFYNAIVCFNFLPRHQIKYPLDFSQMSLLKKKGSEKKLERNKDRNKNRQNAYEGRTFLNC